MVNDFYQTLKSFDRLNTCIYFKQFNEDEICLQYSNLLIVQSFLHNSALITFQRSSNDEAMWDEKLQNWQIFRTNWMDMGYTCCTPLWFDRYRNLIFKTIVITFFNEMEYFALYGFFLSLLLLNVTRTNCEK